MKQHSGKKLLALVLASIMTLQMLPQAFAVSPDSGTEVSQTSTQDTAGDSAIQEPQPEQPAQTPTTDPAQPQPEEQEEQEEPDAELPPTQTEEETPADSDVTPPDLTVQPSLLFGMDAFVLPDDEISCPFVDVVKSKWYYSFVAYSYSLGFVNGRTPQLFAPDENIRVSEGIKIAVTAYRKYHGITTQIDPSSDGHWYTPYVELAKTYGILPQGFDNYEANLTRQQAAALFYYILPTDELKAINQITELPDVGKNNPYYKEILALYQAGILSGTESTYGTFQPTRSIKRSEFAKLLYTLILPAHRTTQTFQVYSGMEAFDTSRYEVRNTFTDVAEGRWYYTYVAVQQTLGLLNGLTATTFVPDGTVTLGQAVAVCVRIYQKYNGITTPIPDAAGKPWYTPYVELAQQYQILPKDWTDYTAVLQRDRLAILLYNTLPEKELQAINKITALVDVQAGDTGYKEILALYNAGVLSGKDPTGTFDPSASVKRSELATMLTRLIDPSYRQEFSLTDSPVGQKVVYGTSGSGRDLCAYQYGNGKNVMVVGFAIHGYEDNYAKDAAELVYTAESLQTILSKNMEKIKSGDWTVYILPCMNPDGLYDGYTNDGPGRCTTSYYTDSGTLSKAHGVDMNRSFPTNFVVQTTSRYYTGNSALACKESRALAAFVRKVKGNGKNVCIDTHGWTQQIITSTGTGGLLYQTLHSSFGQNTYANCTSAKGYFTAYTTSLGYDSCLFEFPGGIRSHNEFLSSGYSAKYISCIMTLLNRY